MIREPRCDKRTIREAKARTTAALLRLRSETEHKLAFDLLPSSLGNELVDFARNYRPSGDVRAAG